MREQLALIDVPRIPTEWDEREAFYSRPEYVWPLCQYLTACAEADPAILARFDYGRAIIEPCVGGGALVDGLSRYWHGTDRDVITGDIRGVGADWQGDWLSRQKHWRWNRDVRDRLPSAGLVLSNPAFTIAREIVDASWRHCPDAIVAMLLPARWYENTEGRGAWLREHNPDRINIGRCEFYRPDGSSAGKGDSTTYEWMIWMPRAAGGQGPRGGHHEIIPWKEVP
jgi:hypothetical protein